jgi:hypothetical protein
LSGGEVARFFNFGAGALYALGGRQMFEPKLRQHLSGSHDDPRVIDPE